MPPLLNWSAHLNIAGEPTLNDQHSELFGLVNKLHEALAQHSAPSDTTRLTEELLESTRLHFADEERLFHRLSEPEAQLHRLHHKHLLEAMEQFHNTQADPERSELAIDQLRQIAEWYQSHVIQCDRKLISPL